MKIIILSILVFTFISYNAISQSSPCFLFDASSINQFNEIKTSFGNIKQTNRGVHDTITADLLLTIKDLETNIPLKGVQAILTTQTHKVSDDAGKIDLIAFGTSGNYRLLISYKDYHCLEIYNIYFRSGEIKWLEIKLKKAN